MKREKLNEIAESYIMGNITQYVTFLKRCNKYDLLTMIEILESLGKQRHRTINNMRNHLEVKT